MVLNIDDTIAVTQNFANIHNLEHVCESLISDKEKQNMWDSFYENMLKTYPNLEPFIERKVSLFSDTTDDPIINEEGFSSKMEFLEGFRDLKIWFPRVIEVLKRCFLDENVPIEVISHGQNPVFRSPTAIIKFYSHIFNGVKTYNMENQAYSIITDHISEKYKKHFSKILGSGYLFNENSERNYRWPYIVIKAATDGEVSLAEVISVGGSSPSNEVDVNGEEGMIKWGEVAEFSADVLYALHSLPSASIPDNTTTEEATEEATKEIITIGQLHPFHRFIHRQISCASKVHSGWLVFPPHLISQISSYLPKSSHELHNPELDGPLAGILHGDLNAENILGIVLPKSSSNHNQNSDESSNNCLGGDDELLGYWKPTTIIDLGDSQVYGGDPLFDLVPIYISVLGCSKLLLKIFLERYNSETGGKQKISLRMFKRRAMCYTLLWEFEGAVKYLMGCLPNIRECKNWEEVEDLVWGIE